MPVIGICLLLLPLAQASPSLVVTPATEGALYPLEPMQYDIQVTNIGDAPIDTVFMEVHVESPLQLMVDGMPRQQQELALLDLLPGETKSKSVVVKARAFSNGTPRITVTFGETQEQLVNEISRAVTLRESPLDFRARLSTAAAAPGDDLTVTIDLRNISPDPVKDIQIRVRHPGGTMVIRENAVLQPGTGIQGEQSTFTLPKETEKEEVITVSVGFSQEGKQHLLEQALIVDVRERSAFALVIGGIILVLLVAGGAAYFMSRGKIQGPARGSGKEKEIGEMGSKPGEK